MAMAQSSAIGRGKRAAARWAADLVEPGMRVGLGSGSTAAKLVTCLGVRIREEGLRFTAVATSARTAALARAAGMTLAGLDEIKWLDLTIDGADEVDDALTLIKGSGGALLHEKIVANASDRMVVIADTTKRVKTLGHAPLPVEVISTGWTTTRALIRQRLMSQDVAGRDALLRLQDGAPLQSAEGNYILDLHLRRIGQPRALAKALNAIPGVVENGLFVETCDTLVLGHPDGHVVVRDLYGGSMEDEAKPSGGSDNLFAELDAPAGRA